MTLKHFLEADGNTGADLAKRIGVSAASVTRIAAGRQNITLALAREIERATDGKVTVAELTVPARAA